MEEYLNEQDYWNKFAQRIDLTFSDIYNYRDYINWETLSCNPHIPLDTIKYFIDKIDLPMLIYSRKDENPIPEEWIEYIETSMTNKAWEMLAYHYHHQLSERFIEKYWDKLNHLYVLEKQKLSEKFIRKHLEEFTNGNLQHFISINSSEIPWSWIFTFQEVSDSFIREYWDYLQHDLYHIIKNHKITSNFIREFFTEETYQGLWYEISCNRKITEDFIEKYKDKLDWSAISEHQDLKEKFILKYADKVNWEIIFHHQTLSKKFIQENSWRVNI